MTGRPSAIGFGFQNFGDSPFGSADWAEEVSWKILPIFYKEDDAKCELIPPEPLRKFINALKPQFQDIIDKWEAFPNLWDANKVPLAQLPQLGYNFNITPSANKDERLQRSEVLNAIQFFVNKGLDNGYVIAGAFSGYLAAVTPIWADSCLAGANFQEEGPTDYYLTFASIPADIVATDSVFHDPYALWPITLEWRLPCRTSWLKLFFFSPDDTEIDPDDFSAAAEDIVNDVERVRPAHVRILSYRFEGPSAIGGGWTISVTAESSAVGGGWTIPVVGELSATGGGWTIPVTAITTP